MTGLKQSSVKLSKTVFPAGLPLGRILGASRLHTQQQGFSLLKAKSPAALPRHAQDSDFEILNVGAARWGFENRHPLHLEHSQPTRLSAPSVWKPSACLFFVPSLSWQTIIFHHSKLTNKTLASRRHCRGWVRRCGAQNVLFAPFIYKNASFYQDRLGTNIGKALKKRATFFSGREGVLSCIFPLPRYECIYPDIDRRVCVTLPTA